MFEEIEAESACYRILLRLGFAKSLLALPPQYGVKYQALLNDAIARLKAKEEGE